MGELVGGAGGWGDVRLAEVGQTGYELTAQEEVVDFYVQVGHAGEL